MMRALLVFSYFCKVLAALLLIPLLFLIATSVPMLFGYQPFCVTQSDNGIYPEQTLTYVRYDAAEHLQPGAFFVTEPAENGKVCTVIAVDALERSVQTTEERVPFECIRGKAAGFRVRRLGTVLQILHRPVSWIILCALLGLSAWGGLWLPKRIYIPRFGQ